MNFFKSPATATMEKLVNKMVEMSETYNKNFQVLEKKAC